MIIIIIVVIITVIIKKRNPQLCVCVLTYETDSLFDS
jgi:hypothetical protein